MGSSSTRRKLERALADRRLVRIDRRLRFADREDGFVVAVGAKWLLLQREVDGGHPDGYLAMRLRDVRAVRKDRSFASKAARALPTWPPLPPAAIELDSTAELLASVGADERLFGVEKERERSALWIGRLDRIDEKKLWLRQLDPKAKWHTKPVGYKFGDITAVTFGDRYTRTLELAAGEPRVAEKVT
jgi:hypothetical protein